MSNEIKLSLDEQETHISFTAQERRDGVINVYSEDPVYIRFIERKEGFEDVSDELGVRPPAKAFRSRDSDLGLSFRRKQAISEEQRAALAKRLVKARANSGKNRV